MIELLHAALSPANIVVTGLLVLVLLYWITVILGLIDVHILDFHVDFHAHSDVDISVDWLNHVLYFFNLGQIPFMFFITFLVIPMWVISILLNFYIGNTSFLISSLLLIPNFVGSLFIAKIFTMPFVKLFAYLNKEEQEEEVIGKVCVATTSISNEKIGQVKVHTKESPLLLNVKTKPGTMLKVGETGLVVEYLQDKNIYLIEPYETL